LGVGVVNAAYWHPINLAGEAALLDLISDGRLEFGIGSGAYQREFDRMFPRASTRRTAGNTCRKCSLW
jgi:alkanesulfonate monooxygenase SsuD/methylene tetrahydromethanopterin reductase-like flavin-dependent oxidoreductase (luciferase family)